jgi:hypothetical protein
MMQNSIVIPAFNVYIFELWRIHGSNGQTVRLLCQTKDQEDKVPQSHNSGKNHAQFETTGYSSGDLMVEARHFQH